MKVKRIVSLTIIVVLFFCASSMVYAVDSSATPKEMKSAYREVVDYANSINVELGMTYDDFVAEYNSQNYDSVQAYVDAYNRVLQPKSEEIQVTESSSGGDDKPWYYDTGEELPQTADYSKYNLMDIVEAGDVIYESEGGGGITGHALIVEGIFYDETQDQDYIRVVEAIDVGVCRSVLDDERVDDKGVSIYRVNDATQDDIEEAIAFCVGEIGASYNLDFAKDTSSSETDWYCSELVWAGYKNQGIDIEDTGFSEPGVTPRDITVNSNEVEMQILKAQ
jgi:uncharacterized protein YycO